MDQFFSGISKRFLNQRENALSPENPSMSAISFSGR